jgi:hypothetical protein
VSTPDWVSWLPSEAPDAPGVSRRLDFGCVWINCRIPLVADMPHGFQESGYGEDL